MKRALLLGSFVLFLGCSTQPPKGDPARTSASTAVFKSCAQDPEKQALRSQELQDIVRADQADRQIPGEQIDWNRVGAADEARAKRVAEIFAEGCFKTAKDYAAAALVFQHGVVPDHYYQAYLWSKKALDLGDSAQKTMIADTVDRYLLSLGYKQLFGAQTFRGRPDGCRCLGPTESRFPERLRVQISGVSLKERIASLRERDQQNPACSQVLYCDRDVQSPPKGLFPGIW